MPYDNEEREVRDRVRRIETRLTILAKALGVEVGGAPVLWNVAGERVQVATPNSSLAEILRAIPGRRQDETVDVYIRDEYVATVFTNSRNRQTIEQVARIRRVHSC